MNLLNLKSQTKQLPQPANQFDLSQNEIELVLRLLQQTTFPVKEIEVLYMAILKLQEQFKSKINVAS